jgi:uncharacterized membrane-anchored protein YhcB (DUF1043 family)
MTDTLIIEALGFLVGLVAVVAPIVRLNSNIATLNVTLSQMREEQKKDFDNHDKRIEKHGEQIDILNTTVANHDARIEILEERKDR